MRGFLATDHSLHPEKQYEPLFIGLICVAIQCSHSRAAVPADYLGTPFDDAVYRAEQKALANKKWPLPGDFTPVQVLFDGKTAVVGSGWIRRGRTSCTLALSEKDAEGKRVIQYRTKNSKLESFGWNWAKPEDPAVDLTKSDALSFAIKISGSDIPTEMFFTITDINPCPISLRDHDSRLTMAHGIRSPFRQRISNGFCQVRSRIEQR